MTCPIENENIALKERIAAREEVIENLKKQIRDMLATAKSKD